MPVDNPPAWLTRCYLILFALLPWSFEWQAGKTWNLTVPAEPLIAVAGLGLLFVFLRGARPKVSGLAWLALAWLVWQTAAAAFSTMPLVSWKYWIVEAGHWWVFFGGLLCWPALWPRLSRVLMLSLAGVAVYTLIHHGFYHFRSDQALLAPQPFFADHTVYAAVLAMVLPALLNFKFIILNFNFKKSLLLLFLAALALSFSRAAWLSMLLAGFAGLALYSRKAWPWLAGVAVLAVGSGFLFREQITARLSADVSAMERVNRHSCALRMAADRPSTGFGPGAYPFQYLPYQRSDEMTRISITEPIVRRWPGNYGRGGGAHSEYLEALAETGWPGLIAWVFLAAGSLATGVYRYRRSGQLAWFALTLSLLTFLLHGLVNEFLHDARVAALVWGQMALLAGGKTGSPNSSDVNN